jgi:DNA-directed RNA polymerase specialized sigma24 family protein
MQRSEDETRALMCVTAREAAAMLGTSLRSVRNLVASGKLEGRRDGDGGAERLLIPVSSVRSLRTDRRRQG